MSAIGSSPWARPMYQPQPYGGVQQPYQNSWAAPSSPYAFRPQQSYAPQQAYAPQQTQPSFWNSFNNNYIQPAWNGIKQGAQYLGNMAAQHPYAFTGAAAGLSGAMMGCPYSAGAGVVSAAAGYMMNRVK